jgi:hypothetical protein
MVFLANGGVRPARQGESVDGIYGGTSCRSEPFMFVCAESPLVLKTIMRLSSLGRIFLKGLFRILLQSLEALAIADTPRRDLRKRWHHGYLAGGHTVSGSTFDCRLVGALSAI